MTTTRKRRQGKAATCLHCDRPAQVRGCCLACYRMIRRDVMSGRYTDEQAVKTKSLLPKGKAGRKETITRSPIPARRLAERAASKQRSKKR